MKQNHPRELLPISPKWDMAQVSQALLRALDGSGPALSCSPATSPEVDSEIAIVIPTSGSSGTPKEVALSARALLASARSAHNFLGAKPGQRWSLLLPINHIAGINVLIRAIGIGTQVIDLRDSTNYVDVDFTAIVPTQLHRALHGDADLLNHLRNCEAVLVGGGATSPLLEEEATAAGLTIITTYGMSEMSGGCIYNHQPIDGAEVKIREDGTVLLRGPMMATTYINNNSLWSSSNEDGWFITPDIGEMRDGKLFILGRSDDQIISGGEKISLSHIENFLHSEFEGVRFIAFGIPDLEWGTKLILASDKSPNIELIREIIRNKFGGHAIPKEFFELSPLPQKGIGKPDRIAAREAFIHRE
jgi:O-succinylbenzoic acid--CoA ligase